MTLYLIPVPLCEEGIEDIPPRTLSIIEKVRFYLVENERSARRFLTQCKLPAPIQEITIIPIPEGENINYDELLSTITIEGADCGILSEAGVPCLADPGSGIVNRAQELGISVVPLVGPSSIYLALSASGLNGQTFIFHGYLPKESGEREKKLREIQKEIKNFGNTHIFIETPYRNDAVFESILKTCDSELRLCIGIELTSSAEQVHTFSISNWQKREMKIGKRPAIFLLGK